jgi:Tol biopolymer transport system component
LLLCGAAVGSEVEFESRNPRISANGELVVFSSDSPLLSSEVKAGERRIFIYSLPSQVLTMADNRDAQGRRIVNGSQPTISESGGIIAYAASCEPPTSGQEPRQDIFLLVSSTKTTVRVTQSAAGGAANGDSRSPSISGDGAFVAFESDASNLVLEDTNECADVFVYDRLRLAIKRVSVSNGGKQGTGSSTQPAISSDGRFIAYSSMASDIASSSVREAFHGFIVKDHVLLFDLRESTTRYVSDAVVSDTVYGVFCEPQISDMGRVVVFNHLDTRRMGCPWVGFIADTTSSVARRVNVPLQSVDAMTQMHVSAITGDGRHVVFDSPTARLASGDDDAYCDVFVMDDKDRIELISKDALSAGERGDSREGSISANGRWVVFTSSSSTLVTGKPSGRTDIYLRDRTVGSTVMVSSVRR